MPYFSIIIPTFNSSLTLAKTIDSILIQTFHDYEILIIDGNSNDNTLDVVNSYHSSRISLFSEKDRGVYDAMNKGIKLSSGKWIYFLGSDDYFYSIDVLEKIYLYTKEKQINVVYGNVISPAFENEIYDGEFNYMKICRDNICHQAIFYKRTIFDKIGLYDLKYKILADYELNLRWFLDSKEKYAYLELVIAYFSDNGMSATQRDVYFEKKKNFLIVKNGLFVLPKWYLIETSYLNSEFLFDAIFLYIVNVVLRFRRVILRLVGKFLI